MIHSPWLGDIESDACCELLFPSGLPGFEDQRRMLPVEIPAQRPLLYLQSLENAEICFAALPVFAIDPGFQLRMTEEERALLQLSEDRDPAIGADVLCVALLMRSGQTVQANLNAAVVINLHNRRGIQCVDPSGVSACFRLSPDSGWTALC
jgi:flagellar assembly factor FliW